MTLSPETLGIWATAIAGASAVLGPVAWKFWRAIVDGFRDVHNVNSEQIDRLKTLQKTLDTHGDRLAAVEGRIATVEAWQTKHDRTCPADNNAQAAPIALGRG